MAGCCGAPSQVAPVPALGRRGSLAPLSASGGEPVDAVQFWAAMGPDAGARRFTGFLQFVLAGGLAPAGKARAVAWKVLLGCHAPHGSLEDWQGEKEAAAAELARLRGLLAGDGAEARAAFQAGGSKEDWDRCAQRIRNDVPRTEPAGDAFMTAEVRARMVALLEAYALADPEVGYCQGMGDVLAVLLRIYDDDAGECFLPLRRGARAGVDPLGRRPPGDPGTGVALTPFPPIPWLSQTPS